MQAWEAACPFHMKSAVTLCKKTLTVMGAGGAEACINRLQQWCAKATEYNRQRLHMAIDPTSFAVVDAAIIDNYERMAPERPVAASRPLHDIELDDAEASAIELARGGRGGRAYGSAMGSSSVVPQPKPKGKSKAKAKALLARDSPRPASELRRQPRAAAKRSSVPKRGGRAPQSSGTSSSDSGSSSGSSS